MKYFDRKEELKEHAELWKMEMELYFENNINECVENSTIYEADKLTVPVKSRDGCKTEIKVIDATTTQAIYYHLGHEKMAALNFASYKHPGGRFLQGFNAQEECLCHESILYNVLERFVDRFYRPNHKRLNNALYNSNLIYSPNILFDGDNGISYCDIITCAAPNRAAIKRYMDISDDEINTHMEDRIDHVLFSAYDNDVEVLILGAFGCGVFGNDPSTVAEIFKNLLDSKYKNCFDKVIFAVPTGKNHNVFKEVFQNV